MAEIRVYTRQLSERRVFSPGVFIGGGIAGIIGCKGTGLAIRGPVAECTFLLIRFTSACEVSTRRRELWPLLGSA